MKISNAWFIAHCYHPSVFEPDKFWSKVQIGEDPQECWPWIGTRNHAGYGTTHFQDDRVVNDELKRVTRGITAHRVAFMLANIRVIKKACICHTCDNPPCCNPNHLFEGTHRDNWADAVKKGRINPNPFPLTNTS